MTNKLGMLLMALLWWGFACVSVVASVNEVSSGNRQVATAFLCWGLVEAWWAAGFIFGRPPWWLKTRRKG